jgi:hypothetical protein
VKTEEVKLLEPRKVRIYWNGFNELTLEYEGRRYENISVLKAFPLSASTSYIALIDQEDKEIGMIEELHLLPDESRRVLEEELSRRYVIPKIIRVLEVDEIFGMPIWRVVTDRGVRTIELKSRNDAKLLPSGRVIIKDMDGNRYEIPNFWEMDSRSRGLLETEL